MTAGTVAFPYTFGAIDALHVQNQELIAGGWVVSLEATPISELRIAINDEPVAAWSQFLPSPDVARAWPQLRGTGSCRFVIRQRLSKDMSNQTALIAITPVVNGEAGVPLERIIPFAFSTAPLSESEQVGHGEFVETSFSFLSLFRRVAKLRPDERVLDAGCGLGRMAFAIAHYLDASGCYEGFDVAPALVASAATRFSSRKDFRFRHVDIFNAMYNPSGALQASRFAFPYERAQFTFAFLTSVFTHMLPDDVENYLVQLRRVVSDDGRCFATFFVIDEESQRNIDAGKSTLPLRKELPGGAVATAEGAAEGAIGYREDALKQMLSRTGWEISQMHPGQWCGRERFLSYQDILLLTPRKPG